MCQDLFDYLSANFQELTKSSGGTTLKKRVYFYIPVEGEGSVPQKRPWHTFREVNEIRKIHSIQTTSTQCRVLTRHRSCFCDQWLQGNGESCVNSELVDEWQATEKTHEGQVAVTRQNQDAAECERVNGITDLVEAGSIVAIAAADDACYDYYLLKVSSSAAACLPSDSIDDYGAAYQKGSFVLKGNFSLRDNIIDITYKLDKKNALVYANTVQAICDELTVIEKQRKELSKLSPAQHEEIMSLF